MSWFSKAVVVVILILSFFFIKDKFFGGSEFKFNFDFFNKTNTVKETPKPSKIDETESNAAYVYFLALDKSGDMIFKKVERQNTSKDTKLEFALKELLKGPNIAEKSFGAYNEIPKGTKLLSVEDNGNSIIVNLNSEFQYGGGTDSIYSRLRQLIKTILANNSDKPVYLYLDGKQANVIGGEGIMVSQPLSETSLDD